MGKYNSFIWVIIVLLFMSCDSNRIFEENRSFANEIWHKDSTLSFNIEITDTLMVYNIYLNNRITRLYEYSNLYLFIDTKLPNGQVLRDTIECLLRNPAGKIIGKGFGNVWSNKIMYRKHIRFPYSGNYKFSINQAMRAEQLEHILDAGIRIEKAKI